MADIDFESWRRDDRRLGIINRMLGLASLGFLAAVVWHIFIMQRTDFIYFILSIASVTAGLGRIFVWRVRGVPTPLRVLAFGAPAAADAAWRVVEANRAALLRAAILPGTIHEKPLHELTRSELEVRVRRVPPGDGRRALRFFLAFWAVLALSVLIAIALHTPEPPQNFTRF